MPTKRDYKAEYKKFQSSTKSKKYRAELNQYNRKKGTYGNGDGKDASHKGGKIAGFEKESVNRGRAEKSRLKKEANMPDFNPMIDKALDEVIEEYTMNRKGVIDKIATLAKANRYGTVDGTQMNGKTAKEIIAIYNHPKMKKFKKAMADYTVDDFVNLSIKLKKVLGIKVNEHTVKFSKADMGKLHKDGEISKKDPDGKAHKYVFKEAGMELKKLEDAIKFFKKKIEKQGRVTNARDEEHLERLMKVYNDMGGRKIKENNELFEWLQEACWKGYEKKGMKTMFGKRYPNCVKKTKKEGVDEGQKRRASDILRKFDMAYIKFSQEVRDVMKLMDKSTGNKTDSRIINKAYGKHLIPFDDIMQSWARGQQNNPKIDESVKEDLMNENPAAIAAAQRMVVQNKMGKKISVATAKNTSYAKSDPKAHKKAKSIWDRIKARFSKKEGVNEGTTQMFSSSKIDKAIKIAKSMGGNMTGAVKKIEKIEKNLSKNGRVEYALQQANEGLGDRISKISKKYAKGQKKSKKALKNKKGPYQEGVNEAFAIQYKKDKRYLTRKELFDKKPLKFKTEDEAKSMLNGLDYKYRTNYKIVKIKEGVNENSAEKEKIFKYLVKKGDNPTDARYELNRSYDFVKKAYKKASAATKARIISDLSKYESVNEDVWTPAETKAVDKIDGEFQKMMAKKGIEPYSVEASRLWRSAGYNKKMRKIFGKNESVNEARLDPKQLLQQLGGNKFIMMTGAKNLAVDKAKNTLHMKIGRNAKGISHLRIKLTGADLYDMEFLQIRAGNIKVKAKVKGIYADQLQKMFTKHTGMYTSLGTMGR